jgi:hypothetical protein
MAIPSFLNFLLVVLTSLLRQKVKKPLSGNSLFKIKRIDSDRITGKELSLHNFTLKINTFLYIFSPWLSDGADPAHPLVATVQIFVLSGCNSHFFHLRTKPCGQTPIKTEG